MNKERIFLAKYESRLPWKIASGTITQLRGFTNKAALRFYNETNILKARLSRRIRLPVFFPHYREIHQNWKTHLHRSALHARISRFALNPVRKRSARRPSISRGWDAANFSHLPPLFILSRWRKISLSLSLFKCSWRDSSQLQSSFGILSYLGQRVFSPSLAPFLSLSTVV